MSGTPQRATYYYLYFVAYDSTAVGCARCPVSVQCSQLFAVPDTVLKQRCLQRSIDVPYDILDRALLFIAAPLPRSVRVAVSETFRVDDLLAGGVAEVEGVAEAKVLRGGANQQRQ